MPAAAIAGVAAVGGSVISASSQKKAANKAADTSLAVAQENNALAKEIYGENKATLSPYMERGNVAGNYLNAFLGLPTTAAAAPASAPVSALPAAAPQNPYSGSNSFVRNAIESGMFKNVSPELMDLVYGQSSAPAQTAASSATPAATTPGVTQQQAQNAFGSYIANSDYGFQFGTGSNAVNSGYAGGGTLQSGAAMKALEDYRQNLQAGYRGEYMNALSNQQGVGLSGASALAGVGQNYVNTVGANNTAAGNAAANAALIKGQNNPFAAGLGALSGTILGGR